MHSKIIDTNNTDKQEIHTEQQNGFMIQNDISRIKTHTVFLQRQTIPTDTGDIKEYRTD